MPGKIRGEETPSIQCIGLLDRADDGEGGLGFSMRDDDGDRGKGVFSCFVMVGAAGWAC